MLTIKELTFSYNNKENVLHNINLEIINNESVALIGANGSGKTSVLLTLTGLYKYKGGIYLNKTEIRDIKRKEIKNLIGIVFQNVDEQLFMPTVYEELRLSMQQKFNIVDEEKIDYCLKKFNLEELKYKEPHNLSAGEKKKVALLSVLIYEPKLLLLDEPTTDLDLKGCNELINIINSLNMTKIISTHNYFFAEKCCSTSIILKKGKVFFKGKTMKIVRDNQILKESNII